VAADIREFFSKNLRPYRSEFDFETLAEYRRHQKTTDYVTLGGERVKSWGELTIANWLWLHDVKYRYEAPFQHKVSMPSPGPYKPDFYLPDYGIYLEYFALNRAGEPPAHFKGDYLAQIAWKREVHRKHGSTLLEFTYAEHREGILERVLAERLASAGVCFRPLSGPEIEARLGDRPNAVTRFAALMKQFLELFRDSGYSEDYLSKQVASIEASQRERAFLRLFRFVFRKYAEELFKEQAIDFHDMISDAASYVRSGHYRSPFTYILVDEFQDVSRGQGRFLKALRFQRTDCKLFGVGDDWQSIYGFRGSDLSLMTQFKGHFGSCCRTDLDQTFRFTEELVQASALFIQKDPSLLRKQLQARATLNQAPMTILVQEDSDEEVENVLDRALVEIAKDAMDASRQLSVFVLKRYNYEPPNNSWLFGANRRYPNLSISASTVHKAKGLEADYVIVVGLVATGRGFPSHLEDDPILNLVRPPAGDFPSAEERRLLYVALTRAKNRVFLLTQKCHPSKFVRELAGAEYQPFVHLEKPLFSAFACPLCEDYTLVRRRGKKRDFFGCANYPYCEGTLQVCEVCNQGVMRRISKGRFKCSVPECPGTAWLCPQCKSGMLIRREGPRGPFWGCMNWRSGGGCNYTEPLAE
jgi:DNA helicase-4